MTISEYCAEIMKQNFDDTIGNDFIKLGFIFYLKKKRYVFGPEPSDLIFTFSYRFLIDNKNICKNTSNILLKNIEKYDPNDFREQFQQELKSWIAVGNDVLLFDGSVVSINEKMELNEKDKITIDRLVDMISIKNIGHIINYNDSLTKEAEEVKPFLNDFRLYTNYMKGSRFENRAFEAINYCVCCEETDRRELVPIHINFHGDISDPYNLIVMCKEHAELYFYGYFKFSQNGKIIIKKSSVSLDKRMHLSARILSYGRKLYLE